MSPIIILWISSMLLCFICIDKPLSHHKKYWKCSLFIHIFAPAVVLVGLFYLLWIQTKAFFISNKDDV
jgi:hypothetical protein